MNLTIEHMADLEILEHGTRQQMTKYQELLSNPKMDDELIKQYAVEMTHRCMAILNELNRIRPTIGTINIKKYPSSC